MAKRTREKSVVTSSMEGAIKSTNKSRGSILIKKSTDDVPHNYIPTGIFALDFALLGGWDDSRASCLWGKHSTGKSLNCLKAIAEHQIKRDHLSSGEITNSLSYFADAEDQFDSTWATQNGVNTEYLYTNEESLHGAELLDVCVDLIENPDIGMIVVDSIPALVPPAIEENSIEDKTMGQLASMMGIFASKVVGKLRKARRDGNPTCLLMINQPRASMASYGSPYSLPGGYQLQHTFRAEVWLKKKKNIEMADVSGISVESYTEQAFEIKKAKSGSSIKQAEFKLNLSANHKYLKAGQVDNIPTVFALAKKMGYVQGGGGKYRLITEETEQTFRTHDDILDFLSGSEDEYQTLARSILASKRLEIGKSALPPDGYLVGAKGRAPVILSE